MDNDSFRKIVAAERDRLHEQKRLLCEDGEALIERCPVWAARSLVVETALECEYARRRMLESRDRAHRVDLYVHGLTFILFSKVLSRIARSIGHSGVSPQESLLRVVDEGGQLDDERARSMLRAGHDELLRGGREAWAMAHRLVRNDPDVSAPEKDQALAALTGIVDGVFSLTKAKKLRIALECEGIKVGSHEFVSLLAGTVLEALDGAPSDQGLGGLRSKVSGLLRNPRETRQATFEAGLYAIEPTDEDKRLAERELAAFAQREERMRLFGAENRKIVWAGLSKQERQVFLMARTLKPKRIAERLGRPPGQVGVELLRAREKYRAVGEAV